MTDLQLFLAISPLSPELKQKVYEYVLDLKQNSKTYYSAPSELPILEEPFAPYKNNFVDMLLHGPVFNKEQIKTLSETRKSINTWRTKR